MKFSAQCRRRPALKWSEGRQHILGFRATSHVDRGRKWDSIEVPRTAECLLCPNGSDLWRTRRKCRHGHQCCRPGTRTCTPKPAAYRPKSPLGRTPWPCQPTLGVPTGAVATRVALHRPISINSRYGSTAIEVGAMHRVAPPIIGPSSSVMASTNASDVRAMHTSSSANGIAVVAHASRFASPADGPTQHLGT